MSVTFVENVTLVKEECCSCGMAFALPKSLQDRFRENHTWFYCPSGHQQHYTGESAEAKLRRELEAQKLETSRQREYYFAEQRKNEQAQRKIKKLNKRSAAGLCPCCNRTFSQVSRHMKTKHPEFVKEIL